MRQSESITKLTESLIKAQAEFITLPKDKSGYGYKYTDLDTVISTVRPILAKYNLGFIQALTTLEDGRPGITTRLISVGGEFLEDTIPLPEITVGKTNAAQNMGAAITYMKRYALCAILGISSDEDTDAATPKNEQKHEFRNTVDKSSNVFDQMTPAAQLERKKAQQAPQPAGGPDTREEHNEIVKLLNSKTPDGAAIFHEDDFKMIEAMREQKTAKQVIDFLQGMVKQHEPAPQPEPEQMELQQAIF